MSKEMQGVTDARSEKLFRLVRAAHAEPVALLAAASVAPGYLRFLLDAGVPKQEIPIQACGRFHYYDQSAKMLAQCLPFARRGALHVFAHWESTPEEEAAELRLALALGAAGFLVVFQVPLASGIAAPMPGAFSMVAPNVMVYRATVLHSPVTGIIRPSTAFSAPHLLLGDPTVGLQEHVDLDPLAAAGVQTMLLVQPDGTQASRAFHESLLCSKGLGLALVVDEEGVGLVDDLPPSCDVPVLRIRHQFAGLEASDAFAAQLAAVLAPHPDRNPYFQRGSATGESAREDGAPLNANGVVPGREDQCGDAHGYISSSFYQRCLPGRRGVYMQTMTIPFDLKLYQRPQHVSTAMAKQNMLVVYVQFNRAVGMLQRSKTHPNIFLADTELVKIAVPTGIIVNVYSTMFMFDDGALDVMANNCNTIVYEYIDAIDEAITGDTVAKLQRMRSTAVRRANLIVYTAQALLKDVSGPGRSPMTLAFVPNGVDPSMYVVDPETATPRSIQHIVDKGKPVVGYFGAIAPWIWLEAILELAELMPEAEFLLIGPAYGDVEIPQADSTPPNLHFHRPVAAQELVRFGRHFTVGFIPFRKGEIAKTTSPLKLFEYFALGLPTVVTDDMYECTRFSEVRSARSPAEFAQQLRLAIRDAADEELRGRILRLAEANSWDRRAQVTLDALTLLWQTSGTGHREVPPRRIGRGNQH